LVLPAATPQDVSRKIAADVSKVLAMPEIREKFSAMGATVVGNPPEKFGAFMRAESDKWAKLIAEAGIQAQ
jgi:tripartite-type tricarboxylate transporter receptor subunit TctC